MAAPQASRPSPVCTLRAPRNVKATAARTRELSPALTAAACSHVGEEVPRLDETEGALGGFALPPTGLSVAPGTVCARRAQDGRLQDRGLELLSRGQCDTGTTHQV